MLVLACLIPLGAWAETPRLVRLAYPSASVRDILAFYQNLTGRAVYVAVGVEAQINIVTEKPIPATEATELIRRTLLESCGIEVRDSGQGDILVNWSQDPKHPHRSFDPSTAPMRPAVPPRLPRPTPPSVPAQTPA